MTLIIAADEIKKTLRGYTPEKSELFHRESARLADQTYQTALKERPEPRVILLSGGAASGKSEYLSVYLQSEDAIVLDGTLPTFQGAKIKIQKALKAGKKVEVHAVLPDNFLIAYVVFLNRERKFDESHFYRTHCNARKTLLQIAQNFPQVELKMTISTYIELKEGGTMRFTQKDFHGNHTALVEYLEHEQYNEEQIRNKIFHDE